MTERARGAETAGTSAGPPRVRRWSDLLPRIASGLVMIGLALSTAIAGGHWFSLFWLAASAAILWEWQHVVDRDGASLRFGIGGITLAAVARFAASDEAAVALALLGAGVVVLCLVASRGHRIVVAAGLAYAGALLVSVSILRASFPGGIESILWLFAVVWGTDIMAYFAGRLIGGPKLWKRLSPSKTWSGFLVGITCGALAGACVAPAQGPVLIYVAIGLLTGAIAQGGDLFESFFKRHYGVKDASHIIPGHGGVMDRLDGFLAAAVFAACLGVSRFGVEAAGAGLFNW